MKIATVSRVGSMLTNWTWRVYNDCDEPTLQLDQSISACSKLAASDILQIKPDNWTGSVIFTLCCSE
jgi:hypothetical protein